MKTNNKELFINEIFFKLKNYLNFQIEENLDFLRVRQPLFYSKLNNNLKKFNGREINFDMLHREKVFSFYNEYNNWALDFIYRNNLKSNNGIFVNLNYLVRDSIIDDYLDIEKNQISIFFLYDGKNIEEKIKKIVSKIYSFLKKFNLKIKNNYLDKINQLCDELFYHDLKKEKEKYLFKINDEEIIKNIIQKKGSSLIKKSETEYSLRHQFFDNSKNLEIIFSTFFELKNNNKLIVIEINLYSFLFLIIANIQKKDLFIY